MATRQRTCVACRKRGDSSELVRLVLSPAQVLVVDFKARLPGAGVWVHRDKACISEIEARPAVLRRGLGVTPDTSELLFTIRQLVLTSILDGLSMAAAGGAIVGGKVALVEALKGGEISAMLFASDISDRSLGELVQADHSSCLKINLPLDKCTLGVQVGKGPRAAVGVLQQNVSVHLRQRLQWWQRLG